MAYTAPVTYVSGAVATASGMNTYVKDNIAYLKSVVDATLAGQIPPAALSSAIFAGALGTTVNGGVPVGGSFGLQVGANKSAGGSEVNFYNRGAAGFDWWGWNGSSYGLVLTLLNTGKLTGPGFYSSTKTAVGAGVTQSFAHGLGAQPRFVWGYNDNGNNNGVTVKVIPWAVTGGNVVWDDIDATNIKVKNGGTGTTQIQVFGIL